MNDPYDQTDKLMVYVDSDHRGCADSFLVHYGNGNYVKWWSCDVEIQDSRVELHLYC